MRQWIRECPLWRLRWRGFLGAPAKDLDETNRIFELGITVGLILAAILVLGIVVAL